jgi:hypothetical protein
MGIVTVMVIVMVVVVVLVLVVECTTMIMQMLSSTPMDQPSATISMKTDTQAPRMAPMQIRVRYLGRDGVSHGDSHGYSHGESHGKNQVDGVGGTS